jgi:hypothetical protein
MRILPKLTYNGLTIVMSNPSRFDKTSLLTSSGGWFFETYCLQPDFNRHQCELRIADNHDPLLPGTKAVLLLGSYAAKTWLHNTKNTLNEIRGGIYALPEHPSIPAVASYFPQDCVDPKDHETAFNPQHRDDSEAEFEDDAESEENVKQHSRTSRSNFGFWLMKDTARVKHIMKHGVPARAEEPAYDIYPSADRVIEQLTGTTGQHFYLDLETDFDFNILCFAFSFDSGPITVVPVQTHRYEWAYDKLPHIFRALAIAMANNITVCHNGAGFDYLVLALKYRIPIARVFDTLIAQHRIFPEAEKSLGHCVSLWTTEHFHKDEGGGGYATDQDAKRMWLYNGKDVFTMRLIHRAQMVYAKRIPGLLNSIEQAMSSIKPYLIVTLQGIRYDNKILSEIKHENDELLTQYVRIINLLIGEQSIKQITGKSAAPLPASNKQCIRYFHEMLGYQVVSRSAKTKEPALAKDAMYKLRMHYDNPIIDLCLAYRELAKEQGSLKFTPWVNNEPLGPGEIPSPVWKFSNGLKTH